MRETLTVLESFGPLLTKRFYGDGGVSPYDSASSFKVKPAEITGWPDLVKLLQSLHDKPKRCIIRGKLTGNQPGNTPGSLARNNANFSDQPLHWFMVDVDGFEPGFALPTDPAAVDEYICAILPAFKGASYYWHFSASASPKKSTLKCHIHFLNRTPQTSAQMKVWAKGIGSQVDSALFSRVQCHYTADPIFLEGAVDPVPVRAGFHQGERDFVDLVVTAEAHEAGAGTDGSDMKLVDPSEKDSIIGLFHKTYSAEQVLLEQLEGFEQVSERRYTWHGGGGTPEGVWVHDDGMHVGSSHNTWPIDGIVNLWDLVRVFKFGDLDHADDDFEQLDIDSRNIGGLPSNQAMLAYAEALPEIQAALREERSAEVDRLKAIITAADDVQALEAAADEIQGATLSALERNQLVSPYQVRSKSLGCTLTKANVEKRLKAVRAPVLLETGPAWVRAWVWVSEDNSFMHITKKYLVSERSFNAMHDRTMPRDENGNHARASDWVLNELGLPVVVRRIYMPCVPPDAKGDDVVFELNGIRAVNTYCPDLAVAMPQHYSAADRRAIRIFEAHAEMLIPIEIERTLFLDYLAYCVQRPGAKIRWAPLLKGVEGDGKSVFVTAMQHILGYQNVRVLDSATLESSDFTGWRVGQCFTGVEEMKLHGHNRHDVFNKLKTPLSNDSVEVHCKGKEPVTLPNTTNYILFTNFDDGMPINDNDRRIMVLRSPFNKTKDLHDVIDPMTYFDDLFDFAIKQHAGALRKWLFERELNPLFKADGRAPMTEARAAMVDMSRRDDEDAIQSLLDEGGLGIYPNLVSVSCLNEQLKTQYDTKLVSGRVKATLSGYGFSMWSSQQVKWRGKNHRFYYRGARPEHAPAEASRLEAERQEAVLESDFAD